MPESKGLAQLFNPRSVAIIGASDSNPWSGMVDFALRALDFAGPVHLVNRRGATVMGRSTVTSCKAIEGPVDAAFLAVPAAALEDALDDMADAGIRYGVVVSSGFAEVGGAGAEAQRRIFDRVSSRGLTLLGPNSLGVVNLAQRTALSAIPVPLPVLPDGHVALVSQSGATAGLLTMQAHRQNIALSHVVAMGNEAMVDLADVLEYLVDDPAVKAIAVFAESIRQPRRFLAAAERALALRKPIVVLKVGTSALTAEVAQAHTGALVGDDRVFDAVCRRAGLVRVDSLEQLLVTAAVMAHVGPLDGRGFAAASVSGGACEVMADTGSAAGIRFTRFAPQTLDRLKGVLADFGAAHNPLDVTGAVMAKPEMLESVLKILGDDPDVGLLACTFDMPTTPALTRPFTLAMLDKTIAGLAAAPCPTLMLEQTMKDTTDHARSLMTQHGLRFLAPGMEATIKAVGSAYAWSARLRKRFDVGADAVAPASARPRTERATLEYLESRGVPVIPARIASQRTDAEAAAKAAGGPVVLKILSPDIAHKTEVGGVLLNISGDQQAGAAYEQIIANVAKAAPEARIEGVLVSPMRSGGIELFVGVARDPSFGLAIAVGLGGVWVEALADTSLRLLPVGADEVVEMFGELKAQKLLHGYRGSPPVDIAAVSRVVAAIGDAALALGPQLAALEINPLLVMPDRIEALDALATWTTSGSE